MPLIIKKCPECRHTMNECKTYWICPRCHHDEEKVGLDFFIKEIVESKHL